MLKDYAYCRDLKYSLPGEVEGLMTKVLEYLKKGPASIGEMYSHIPDFPDITLYLATHRLVEEGKING